jgi:OmpA-OmpF porin, OOP family
LFTVISKYYFFILVIFLQQNLISFSQTGTKENLGEKINSRWDERAPVISPDGMTLFFTRGNHPENKGFGLFENEQDIWYSTLNSDSTWSKARNIGAPLNTEYPNSVCSVTPDGNTLLLLGVYNADGTSDAGYSISRRTRNGWSPPQKLNIKNYYNYSRYAIAYLENNGNILFLAAERLNSIGKKDIFISHNLGDNNWSEPENIGTDINTADEEYSPFLASDGKTLYFSSKGHVGYGGYDVFVSKRLDDSWRSWSIPENLGPSINSPEDDLFFKIPSKGDYVYFLSYGNSFGEGDIFRILLPEKLRPQPVVLLKGRVVARHTDEPLEAEIHYETLPDFKEVGKAYTNPKDGEYKITLPAGSKYRYYASANDYISYGGEIDLTDESKYSELDSNIVLSAIETGQVLSLDNIIFKKNEIKIESEYNNIIENIILLMNGNPSSVIEVIGWMCGNEKSGIDSQRAKIVANEIIKRFIQPNRVSFKSSGISNNSDGNENCSKVEFKIINK